MLDGLVLHAIIPAFQYFEETAILPMRKLKLHTTMCLLRASDFVSLKLDFHHL
jgi:hypothetical protein